MIRKQYIYDENVQLKNRKSDLQNIERKILKYKSVIKNTNLSIDETSELTKKIIDMETFSTCLKYRNFGLPIDEKYFIFHQLVEPNINSNESFAENAENAENTENTNDTNDTNDTNASNSFSDQKIISNNILILLPSDKELDCSMVSPIIDEYEIPIQEIQDIQDIQEIQKEEKTIQPKYKTGSLSEFFNDEICDDKLLKVDPKIRTWIMAVARADFTPTQ